MTAIKGIVKGGRLEVEVPHDWPDGIEVEILPVAPANNEEDTINPVEISRLLEIMDRTEPLEMTDAELAAWEAERQTQKVVMGLSLNNWAT